MRNRYDKPKRSALDTIEAALLLFALTCITVGTIAGIGIAGLARQGCTP